MKEIEIGSKKFSISCHASCYSQYADIFKRNIIEDLQIVSRFSIKQLELAIEYSKANPKADSKEIEDFVFQKTLPELDNYIECITKLCWICIYDNNSNIGDYDSWYKSLERLSLSDNWMLEVMALCANCFR